MSPITDASVALGLPRSRLTRSNSFWPAETTNLSETAAPLFDFVDALVPPGRVTAREMFGADGWVVHSQTNPFGFTGVIGYPLAFWMPDAGGWLAQHYWEPYQFTQDQRFLKERAYPLMKELAAFWIDELQVDPRDGKLVVSPSFSPEHGDYSAGAAMPQQIVWDLFTNLSEAAPLVGESSSYKAQLASILERLDPGTKVGSWGQLQDAAAEPRRRDRRPARAARCLGRPGLVRRTAGTRRDHGRRHLAVGVGLRDPGPAAVALNPVEVKASVVGTLAAGDLKLTAPDGWTVSPAVQVPAVKPGKPFTTTFTVTPTMASGEGDFTLTASHTSPDGTLTARAGTGLWRDNSVTHESPSNPLSIAEVKLHPAGG